jgi:hypothetical protein
MNIDPDLLDDDLSSAMGTETLLAHDLVPDGLLASSKGLAEQQIHHIGGARYLVVDQTANRRHSSKVSKIWQYGIELRALDSPNLDKYWLCHQCLPATQIYKIGSSDGNSNTGAAIRHLKKDHKVDYGEKEEESASSSPTPSATISSLFRTASAKAAYVAQGLVTRIRIDDFRWFLLKWIVQMHVALVMIESESFRELVHVIAPALDEFMISSATTIRNWILKLFEDQSLVIKAKLAKARSKVHISFDGWTAPNHRAFIGIVAHWLDEDLKKQDLLIGLRRIKGSHSGENIAEAILPVLKLFQLGSNIGFFIADNAGPNDTAIRAILRDLNPDIKDPDSRRVRCFAHIINLVAKAFLFGKDVESLEIHQNRSKAEIKELLEVRQDWLDHGPYGKLHKTVEFIKDSPQRRDEWFSMANSGIDDEFEGM